MSLIECGDCGKQISEKAEACPHCGCPTKVGAQQSHSDPVKTAKNRGVYIILGLIFGCLGFHNFYAGYYGRGVAQLLITLLLGWIVIGMIITVPWALLEIIAVSVDASGNSMT